MKWNDIKESKPETYKDVVVRNAYDCADSIFNQYAIAYLSDKGTWHATIDMLRAHTAWFVDTQIELDGSVTHWASLEEGE